MDAVSLFPYNEAALKTLIYDAVKLALASQPIQQPRPKIKGIQGLAEALGCSVSKAFQLKNSGAIRYFQDGKLVLFDYDQVIEDLKGVNINKRGKKATNGR